MSAHQPQEIPSGCCGVLGYIYVKERAVRFFELNWETELKEIYAASAFMPRVVKFEPRKIWLDVNVEFF